MKRSMAGIISLGLLMGCVVNASSDAADAAMSQQHIKNDIIDRPAFYPYVSMIRDAKSVPEEILYEVIRYTFCYLCDPQHAKDFVSAIRSLTPAELDGIKKQFEESEAERDHDLRNWHSPEAVAQRKKEQQELELEQKRWEEEWAQDEKKQKQEQEEIDRQSRAPEVVKAVNGFVNALQADAVKKATNQFGQVFMAQWKKGIPIPEKPELDKIFDTIVLTMPLYQKTNKQGKVIYFSERSTAEGWNEYRALSDEIEKIEKPVNDILWAYRFGLRYFVGLGGADGKVFLPVIRDSLQVVVQELKAQGVK